MNRLFEKLDNLIALLVERQNSSADFFINVKIKLEVGNRNTEELDALIKCYVITQYANFLKKEEDVLNQIIDLARAMRNKSK
jgi:hypothetical protein